MDKPDLNTPPPIVTSIEQAQALINELWPLRALVAELREELETVKEQVGLTSRNSSLAPSQDRPGQGKQDKGKKKRKRGGGGSGGNQRGPGGQLGHPGHY